MLSKLYLCFATFLHFLFTRRNRVGWTTFNYVLNNRRRIRKKLYFFFRQKSILFLHFRVQKFSHTRGWDYPEETFFLHHRNQLLAYIGSRQNDYKSRFSELKWELRKKSIKRERLFLCSIITKRDEITIKVQSTIFPWKFYSQNGFCWAL